MIQHFLRSLRSLEHQDKPDLPSKMKGAYLANAAQQVADQARPGVIRAVRPWEANTRAVAKANPNRPRYAKWGWPNCQRWRSLLPAVKKRRKQPSDLPGWKGTARVEREVEEPGRPGWEAAGKAANYCRESITCGGPDQESDRPVRAGKRGNARGAKGPCRKRANVKGASDERRAAWLRSPLRNWDS